MKALRQVETEPALVSALAAFPLLPRQWQSLRHFREDIAAAARAALARPAAPHAMLRDAAAALAVLERQPLAAALAGFLAGRRAAVLAGLAPGAAASAGDQVTALALAVHETLAAAAALFVDGGAAAADTDADLALHRFLTRAATRPARPGGQSVLPPFFFFLRLTVFLGWPAAPRPPIFRRRGLDWPGHAGRPPRTAGRAARPRHRLCRRVPG